MPVAHCLIPINGNLRIDTKDMEVHVGAGRTLSQKKGQISHSTGIQR